MEPNRLRRKNLLLLLPILVIGFWLLLRWGAYQGSAYQFARNKIETSPAVKMEIGKVVDVSFPIMGRYSASYGEKYSDAHMDLTAKGEKGSASLVIDLAGGGGVWKVKNSTMNGRPVELD